MTRAADRQIDRLVYELFGLMEEEIRIPRSFVRWESHGGWVREGILAPADSHTGGTAA